jgi:hypothetical protein
MTYFADALFVTFFITAVVSAPFDPPAAGLAIQSLRIFGPLGGPKAANLEGLNQYKRGSPKTTYKGSTISTFSVSTVTTASSVRTPGPFVSLRHLVKHF